MRKIIHDFDCTFGISGCDVDDGLALLYLLGDSEAEVLGVTTTYGNNTLEKVYPNAKKFLQAIKHPEIPVYKGGAAAGDYDSEAAHYLAEMAEQYAGELEILVTGSVTNLYGAWKINPEFFKQVKRIVMMGGTTEPLIFAKKEMDELNFSCDPLATYTVLTSGCEVAVITGNNCLKVLFTKEEYDKYLSKESSKIAKFITDETDYWFGYNMDEYGIPGYYNWDAIAAVYMLHPEFFETEKIEFNISIEDLKTGRMSMEGNKNCTLEIPQIAKVTAFVKNLYSTWLSVEI